ncbi:MAG: TetR/AcrR family transcriptional regulator [Acetobacteraceae bacterium]|nr:TetR/AcrR family transcriptional regulator [Acetobacteraceae bacterium]
MAFTAIPIVLDELSPQMLSGHAGVADKRRRLRIVAARMFAERGVAATSLQGLARHAGIGASRVGSYYDGKQDLLAEVMHDHLAALGLRIDIAAAAEAEAHPEDQLIAMVEAFLEGVQADRASHLVLLQETKSLTVAERRMVASRYKLLAYAFGDPLVAAVPALRPRPALTKAAALSLATLASGSAVWFRPTGAVDLPTYAQMLVQMTLAGARGLRRRRRRAVSG